VVLSSSFQHTYILETVQKSFIPIKLSLLPWNFYFLSIHQYSAISAYLMPIKFYEIPIEIGLMSCSYNFVQAKQLYIAPTVGGF
jgi:hypothetical protein